MQPTGRTGHNARRRSTRTASFATTRSLMFEHSSTGVVPRPAIRFEGVQLAQEASGHPGNSYKYCKDHAPENRSLRYRMGSCRCLAWYVRIVVGHRCISRRSCTKKVRTGFPGIAWLKAPDLPYSSVFPVRALHVATAMPVRGVEKMTHRTQLETTSFPDGKETCRKTDG